MTTILGFETHDVRFPTSRMLDGSDAMNPDPDYSAAALILRTDAPDGLAGHAHVFTIGRGKAQPGRDDPGRRVRGHSSARCVVG
jgi:L-fuconate dehydratase